MEIIEEIVGERQRLSHIDNRMNEEAFVDLRAYVREFSKDIRDNNLRTMFERCFFNTLYTTTFFEEDGSVFIITGDIPAMWLRDSSAQVMQYLFFAKECDSVRRLIKGLLKKQFQYILIDPYANAFNRAANGNGHAYDLDKQSPWVWERKFELDSLCYPLWLLIRYYEKTGDSSCLDELFLQAFDLIIQTFRTEQNHAEKSTYYHEIYNRDKSRWCGRGEKVSGGGLVWSGYRPSDDKCQYGYYLPGNMFIVAVLTKLAPLLLNVLGDSARAKVCQDLAAEIQAELKKLAVVEKDGKKIYALETDGLGNYNVMDDANIPNLLAMPYYEYPYIDKEVYENTRASMLSFENPYYFEGKILKGIGSPHTPQNRVWPLSLIIRALTSEDGAEIQEAVAMLVNSTGGTGYIHEAVDKDDDRVYSRAWFAWANSLFAYMILEKIDYIQ
ncbi:MAG: glycoside hydrolase family 125 protein [Clostridia bacterium]|nr:glycoside hydrolase family 125 protein [Clostridia bacterium]